MDGQVAAQRGLPRLGPQGANLTPHPDPLALTLTLSLTFHPDADPHQGGVGRRQRALAPPQPAVLVLRHPPEHAAADAHLLRVHIDHHLRMAQAREARVHAGN